MDETCINHIENRWQSNTMVSNDLFQQRMFNQALRGYQDALSAAEVLNNHHEDCMLTGVPFIQMYIISCNNMANTYIELRQTEDAENMLKRVVYYLLHLIEKKTFDIHEIENELKRAAVEYVNFVSQTGGNMEKQGKLFSLLKNQLIDPSSIPIS